jgi:transposase, IS5 family
VAIAMWGGACEIGCLERRDEKIFGTWKRCYGLRRMRWRGLARATAQVLFTAIAYNLKHSLNILAA